MTRIELYDAAATAKHSIDSMTKSGRNTAKERDQLKNMLYNNVDVILEALNGTQVVNEVDPAEVQELREELEAAEDALAGTDNKVKVLKFLMKENGLDPNKLLSEYEAGLNSEANAKEVKKGGKK